MNREAKEFLLAIGIVVLDLIVFFVPIAAVVLAYVVIMKPKWFKTWVDKLYTEDKK